MKVCRLLCAALLMACLTAAAHAQLPSFEQVRNGYVASDGVLLDRRGEPLSDVRLDYNVRRLAWTPLTQLSPAMREALLAAEDKRFFEHPGIDWRAFVGAAWQNMWNRTQRGASTLTMQVAGLLEPELRLPSRGRRSYSQKWDQSVAAIELEQRWTKAQILEAYLNLAPLRGDLQGLAAGSAFIFGLKPQAITRREAVILAALLRGPNAKPDLVGRRACALAQTLGSAKMCAEIMQLAKNRLDAPRGPQHILAPQLAREVLRQPGQVLTSTLDATLQRKALEAVQQSGAVDAAVLVLDNASNEALVWVGAPAAAQPDGVNTRRLLPQWWWPYAASVALETRQATAATVLADPLAVAAPDAFLPLDSASLRVALSQHRAGPMAALLQTLPPNAVSDRLHLLGLDAPPGLDMPDSMGEVSLSHAAAAWRALATGAYGMPHVQPGAVAPPRVLSAAANFIVLDMLATQGGAGWNAQWASVSPDAHQAMLVGSTDRLTIAVAVSLPTDHAERIAQQVWRQVASGAQREVARAPQPPEGVAAQIVVFDPPAEPARREWFIRAADEGAERYRRF
ncbi:MAG: transglycosylase domain-containing protein [Rhodocyclaceae bacterium]